MYVIECAQVSTKSEMMEEGNVANGTYGFQEWVLQCAAASLVRPVRR